MKKIKYPYFWITGNATDLNYKAFENLDTEENILVCVCLNNKYEMLKKENIDGSQCVSTKDIK